MKVLFINGSPNEHGCTYTCEERVIIDGSAGDDLDGARCLKYQDSVRYCVELMKVIKEIHRGGSLQQGRDHNKRQGSAGASAELEF